MKKAVGEADAEVVRAAMLKFRRHECRRGLCHV